MYNIKYFNIITAICLCFPLWLSAQVDIGAELLKPFKAKLAESIKKTSMPILPPLDTAAGRMEYNVVERQLTVTYPDPIIRPLAMPAPKAPEAYGLYAKAGFGYPISPSAELSYHNKQSKNLKFGINARHLSSQGNLTHQTFGNTHIDLGGTYFLEKGLAIGANLGVNIDAYRFYGYHELRRILPDSLNPFPDSLAIDKDSVKQQFFEFYGNVHLFNGQLNKAQFNYRGDIDLYVLNDRYGASEFVIAPKASVDKWLGRGKTKHRLFADLCFNMASFNKDTTGNSRALLNFHPGIDLNFGMFKATAATNLGLSEGSFFIFPDIRTALSLAGGMFNAYAGWGGEMCLNTFRSLSLYNPFISSTLELRHTSFSEFFGGLSGDIKGIGYDFRVGYAMTKNTPLFFNDPLQNYMRFNVLYDDINILNFKGSLDFRMVKNLVVMAAVGYNVYMGGNAEKAFHLPIFTSNFTAEYHLKALTLKAEVYFNAGVPYFNILENRAAMLDGLFDVNFGASYWFGKKQNIGAFAEVNNILNNKNQRWFLYQQLGFNGRLGILAKF